MINITCIKYYLNLYVIKVCVLDLEIYIEMSGRYIKGVLTNLL